MKKIILIVLLILTMGVFSACGEAAEETSSDSSQDLQQTAEQEEDDTYDNTAVTTELFSGSWTVGQDITAGKYIFTTSSESGNFVIYDTSGIPYINEILCAPGEEEDSLGVSQISVYLGNDEVIEISGINNVTCTPATTQLSTTLCAGMHYVGWDIEEGNYIVTTTSGSGNFVVYDTDGIPQTNEILCAPGEEEDSLGVSKIKVKLGKDETVEVSGINTVNFEKI